MFFKKEETNDAFVIIGIFACVAVGAFGYLLFCSFLIL